MAELARRQYGVVGREQLRALGLSERAIQHRLTDVVENLLREMEFRQLWDRLSLWDLVERYPGRRGVRKVRVALERLKSDPPGPKRSRLEERLRVLLGVEK